MIAVESQTPAVSPAESPVVVTHPSHLKFGASDGFQLEVRREVDEYFARTGKPPRDCAAMYLKTAIVVAWFVASYALLVFAAPMWWLAVPLAISLGFSMACVGFNVQHDGGHRAYSDRKWVNRVMANTLDVLGASSYIWARKHNIIHHSYTNVTGHDDDINVGFFGRLSPHQRRLKFHRLQHFYLWALYGVLPVKWQYVDDFRDFITGRIGDHAFPRPRGWDLATFVAGKLAFFALALLIPLLLHPVWQVFIFYAITAFVQGVTLSVVFQMAHCVEEAEFPMPAGDTGRIESAWAAHQVETTVDFARENRPLSWLVGGLNFQIEHHLFPHICHIHYAALAPLVEATCRRFGLRYRAHRTFRAGIASHYHWLRRMGAAIVAPPALA